MHRHPYDHDHDSDDPGPGQFAERATPLARDYHERAFTVGIGGPVGSGKSTWNSLP